MNNVVRAFELEIKQSKLSKTDKYWLDQVDFKFEDKNLNIHVRSEFIKSSIEKKLYEKIKDSYKKVTGFDDCVFILDKNMKIPDSEIFFEEKYENSEVETIETIKVEPDFSTFDDLFVGGPNNLAVTAAKSVVSSPGKRFNTLFIYRNISFIDDYAHHPSEISCVLTSLREVYREKEIVCIFQPHRVSRLNSLKDEFTKCFKHSDYLILCPVFKAGENIKLNFNYKNFAKQIIKNSKVNLVIVNEEKDILKYVKQNIFGDKIVIGMGAGSISNWMRSLEHKLK